MKRRTFLALLATLLPLGASAFDWSASAGLEYTRDDWWMDSLPRQSTSQLNLNLSLNLAGFLSRPSTLTYVGGVNYHRLSRDDASGRESVHESLFYRGQVYLFSSPRSPLRLTLRASRQEQDFTLTGAQNGSSVVTQFGGQATVAGRSRPTLRLGYDRTDLERTGFGSPTSELNVQTVNGGITSGNGTVTYGANYRGTFSDGTYATDHYSDHRVDVDARASIGKRWNVILTDSYYLRDPPASGQINPRQEYNIFTANLSDLSSPSESQAFNYVYVRGLQEAPGTNTIERTSQRLGYQLQRNLDEKTWRLAANADVSWQQSRNGSATTEGSAETLGSLLYWSPQGSRAGIGVRGGPSVGFVQPVGQDPYVGWGLSGGASWTTPARPGTLRLSYDVSYVDDLRVEGRVLTQAVQGSVRRPLGSGNATASLQATSSRNDSPLFGTYLGRNVLLDASYTRARFVVRLQAGLSDSANAALHESITGDALIVAPYDNHTRYALVDGAARVTVNSRLYGQFRLTGIEIPDRPSTFQTETRAGIEFDYGALRLALEDRFTTTSSGGSEHRVNEILVRFYRVFGSRF